MTAGVRSAWSCTISLKTDSVISPPNSMLPNETSHAGALVSMARLTEGLVSFSMTCCGSPSIRTSLATRVGCASAMPMAKPAPIELPTNVACGMFTASMNPTKKSNI